MFQVESQKVEMLNPKIKEWELEQSLRSATEVAVQYPAQAVL